MRFDRLLALAAALALGAPASGASGRVVWIELCDASHPGQRIPLPSDGDRKLPGACHASCGTLPGRQTVARKR